MRDQDSVAVLADDVHGRFFWMVSPDAKGNHTVSHESVRKVVELTEAIQSQQDGAQGGDAEVVACELEGYGSMLRGQIKVMCDRAAATIRTLASRPAIAPQATPAAVTDEMVARALGVLLEHCVLKLDTELDTDTAAVHAALTAALAAPPAEVKP